MDTRNENRKLSRYVILLPHRDALKTVNEYRQKLFSAGISGAYSFPPAALLAELSSPFTQDELKDLALNIRERCHENRGIFFSTGTGHTRLTDSFGQTETTAASAGNSFFGFLLNHPLDEEIFSPSAKCKVLREFLPPVLCAAIIDREAAPHTEAPALSFSAAALANLSIRHLDSGAKGYSFEWRISSRVWLPARKKA